MGLQARGGPNFAHTADTDRAEQWLGPIMWLGGDLHGARGSAAQG
jgi:hypothetical protein